MKIHQKNVHKNSPKKRTSHGQKRRQEVTKKCPGEVTVWQCPREVTYHLISVLIIAFIRDSRVINYAGGFRAYRDKSSILFGNLCGNLSGNLSGNSQLGPSLEKFIRKSSWAGIHCWESCLDISWKCINFAELSLLSLNIFLGKFVYFSILDEKIHNYVKKSCEFYHPKIEKYTHFTLKILANMATSGGHFSHPSGMGGYWGYSGWKIFEMAIIRKEWH